MSTLRAILEQKSHPLQTIHMRSALLDYSSPRKRGLEIIHVRPQRVYDNLVIDEEGFTFASRHEEETERNPAEPVPEVSTESASLETPYEPEQLQMRLAQGQTFARYGRDDLGETILFITLGQLRWAEDAVPDKMMLAPLLLIPVRLERNDAGASFTLHATGEDPVVNPLLERFLYARYGIEMPAFEPFESDNVNLFLDAVSNRLEQQESWSVERSKARVDFFEVADVLKEQGVDLEDASKANLEDSSLLHRLLVTGFDEEPPLAPISMDILNDPSSFYHVLDADNEQSLVLFKMQKGCNLTVVGPPGTGKTQTAVNAAAMALGIEKKVLIVSNKVSSLDWILQKLDDVGLGHLVLPLYGDHVHRRRLPGAIQKSRSYHDVEYSGDSAPLDTLVRLRDQLNVYSHSLHTPIRNTGITPYQVLTALTLLDARLKDLPLPEFDGALFVHWTDTQFKAFLPHLEALQAHCARLGIARRHPFWGSKKTLYTADDKPEIQRRCRMGGVAIRTLRASATDLAHQLGMPAPGNSQDVIRLLRTASRLIEAPDVRGVQVVSEKWEFSEEDLLALLETGVALSALHEQFDSRLMPEAWQQDVLEIRHALVAHGKKKTRLFIGDYRLACERLARLCRRGAPSRFDERIEVVNAILEAQRLQARLDKYEKLAGTLFGRQWMGMASKWTHLDKVARWLIELHQDLAQDKVSHEILDHLRVSARPVALKTRAKQVANDFNVFLTTSREAARFVDMEESLGISKSSFGRLPFGKLISLFAHWEKNADSLQDIVAFNHLASQFGKEGLSEIVQLAVSWPESAGYLADFIKRARYRALLDDALNTRRALAGFSDVAHQRLIDQFCASDREYMEVQARQISQIQQERMMRTRFSPVVLHDWIQELEGVPRRSLRAMMTGAGPSLQNLKPVFVMTPASAAMLLGDAGVHFDLLIVDDADRLSVRDALGLLARSKQVLVFGDSYPPGVFRASEILNPEEDERAGPAGEESLLDALRERGAYTHHLRWRYGDGISSLARWIDAEVYDERTLVFPEAREEGKSRRVRFHEMGDANPDSNGASVSSFEGQLVDALLREIRNNPDRSFGAVAFSEAEVDSITRELEKRRREDLSLEAFFEFSGHEPFYLKTINSARGDQRDVVFWGVSFTTISSETSTAHPDGAMPLDAVRRGLASLSSLARRQCHICSDTSLADIKRSGDTVPGITLLARFFEHVAAAGDRQEWPASVSEFEEMLAESIRNEGYVVAHRIGRPGMEVDLTVLDEDGGYLLGILSDGIEYGRIPTARERDRLQPHMLRARGWQIYRLWSVEWFRNPQRELQKIVDAIEGARAGRSMPVEQKTPASTNGSTAAIRDAR